VTLEGRRRREEEAGVGRVCRRERIAGGVVCFSFYSAVLRYFQFKSKPSTSPAACCARDRL
jgi:hypothetical protein